MLFSRFKRCVETVKAYQTTTIGFTVDVLESQKEELKIEQTIVSREVKRTIVNAQALNLIEKEKLAYIKLNEIPKLQNSLRAQQKNNIYSESKKLTLSRLIRKKLEAEVCERAMKENTLRIKQAGLKLRSIIEELDSLNNESGFMNDCTDVKLFFDSQSVKIDGIADYELERYFRIFSNKGEIVK